MSQSVYLEFVIFQGATFERTLQFFARGYAPKASLIQARVGSLGGRFLDVVLRMPVATATVSQVVQGHVSLRGYFA